MKRFLSFFLAFTLSVLLAAAGEKVTYRYAPDLHKTITYQTVMKVDIPTPTGKVQEIYTRMKTHLTPLRREGNLYVVEGGVSDISIEMPGLPMIEQVSAQLKEVNAMLSKMKITSKVDEHGRNVGKPTVEGLPDAIMRSISSQMEQLEMSNDLQAFPATPIGEGDTWSDVVKDDKKDIKADYRLVKITPKTLVVHSKGSWKLTAAGGQQQDFMFDAEAEYSRATGLLLPGTMKVKFEGTAKDNGDSFPMKMEMNM